MIHNTIFSRGEDEDSTIKPIAKYDEEKQDFVTTIDKSKLGLSLSVVSNKYIYDEGNPHFDYILFANGNRANDITKDGVHPFPERDYTKKIKDYFVKKKKNIIVEQILLDNDSPLSLEATLVADYVDRLAQENNIETISLIGHSKCGAMFFNVPKSFKNPDSFIKTSITTTATPYRGCLIASPKFFLKDVKTIIDNQLPKPLNTLVYNALENYYRGISSGSHMDNDIALPGYTSDKYDPTFILGMFDQENIKAIQKIRSFRNFITGVDDKTLVKSLKRRDFISVGMCLMDRYFMKELTDGFIEVKSQESVNQYFLNSSNRIESSTHYFLTHEDEMARVLDYVNESIDEYKEKKEFKRERI